jgi:hypothetical protein
MEIYEHICKTFLDGISKALKELSGEDIVLTFTDYKHEEFMVSVGFEERHIPSSVINKPNTSNPSIKDGYYLLNRIIVRNKYFDSEITNEGHTLEEYKVLVRNCQWKYEK